MPLLIPFNRAGTHEKVLQVTAYIIAGLMAILVILPFVFMVVVSMSDATDHWAGRRWPDLRHLVSPDRMYRQYLSVRYDYFTSLYPFNEFYGYITQTDFVIDMKEVPPLEGNWKARARDGVECLKAMPWSHYDILFSGWSYYTGNVMNAYTGLGQILWAKHLKKEYRFIREVNKRFETDFITFAHVILPALPSLMGRQPYRFESEQLIEFRDFMGELGPEWKIPRLGSRLFRWAMMARPDVKNDIKKLNAIAGTSCDDWKNLVLDETVPAAPGMAKVWTDFARNQASAYMIELVDPASLLGKFRAFLAARHGDEENVRLVYGGVPLSEIPLPATVHQVLPSATAYYDWDAFVRSVPIGAIRMSTPETIWRRFLENKYNGSIESMNREYGIQAASFKDVPWPQPEIDRLCWSEHRLLYISEVLFKNYRRIWRWMTEGTSAAMSAPNIPAWLEPAWLFVTNGGGAFLNTILFAILFTSIAVIVNTCAAYVLSRYHAGVIQISLVYFLSLAAFPIEAMAVPNFLLLRNLGLLNTIWALALPTAVNGYYIYLLKGFFDTIPRDYFEEATIYGAGEWGMFWKVALPFARPMMAVVALYAFLWSYSNFIWALIACQQRVRWTLPVLIFNINTWNQPPGIVSAAMVLTLLVPLIVFAFSHRTLQRALSLPRV